MTEKIVQKVNLGLELVENYNKVKIDFLEAVIEADNEEEVKGKIRTVFSTIREEVAIQFLAIKLDKERSLEGSK